MAEDFDKSIGEEATLAGKAKQRPSSEVSLGDERTLGDNRSGQDTVIDDIEVVNLEARYRVEGTLDQGGMGAVLLATDTRLGRKVAIKRILGEAAGNRMAVQRFLTEAKAIAALNHPNIVQIYDYGRAKDGPFLIMEYVDGGNLLDRCRESALPLDEAIDLACHLCDGLAKAHDLGIIHRDIKPANVLLTKDGTPKLTDFGLAKAQAGDHGQTMTGAVLGTPDFMPPEQRRDASLVDHRSDLWSLAATIYQMLTGRNPKVIKLHELPLALQAVMARALEDSKDARYQSAQELRDALKMGFRPVEPATGTVAVGEGQCPNCRVQNDAKRRFCRRCGGSLEAPCLACTQPVPMWDEICGACGAKQTPLADSKRLEMLSAKTRAEQLLAELNFSEATAIATGLRDEPHPRLAFFTQWAATFLEEVHRRNATEMQAVEAMLSEAMSYESQYDYTSAIKALECVPLPLRSVIPPHKGVCVADVLARTQMRQDLSRRLYESVQAKMAAELFDAAMPDVDKLFELQPHRIDIQRIREQLIERRHKQQQGRDAALAKASVLMREHRYDEAVTVLEDVPAVVATNELEDVRRRAKALASQATSLLARIRSALEAKQFDGLQILVAEYLQIKPNDEWVSWVERTLAARQQKIDAKRVDLIAAAKQLLTTHRYEEAIRLIDSTPAHLQAPTLRTIRDNAGQALATIQKLGTIIRDCVDGQSLDGLLPVVEEYLRLQPGDTNTVTLREKLVSRERDLGRKLELFQTRQRELLSEDRWETALQEIAKREWRKCDSDMGIRTNLTFAAKEQGKRLCQKRLENRQSLVLNTSFYGAVALIVAAMLYGIPDTPPLYLARGCLWILFGLCAVPSSFCAIALTVTPSVRRTRALMMRYGLCDQAT